MSEQTQQTNSNVNSNTNVDTTSLTIMTERNQPLTATVYTPIAMDINTLSNDGVVANQTSSTNTHNSLNMDEHIKPNIKTAVMIAPATGIKRQFYTSFASFLCSQGFGVISFDNEGIGDSLTSSLSKCDASLITWGRHDLTAVLDALQVEFPNANYHLVGHSAGGQLIGLMPNHNALKSVVNVACSSGCIKNMDYPFKLQAKVFMDVAIPLGNLTLGYTPSDKFGMGEPLPRGVARQWREWCNASGYVKTGFNKTIFTHYYNDITTPSLWLNFTDDDIANAKNVTDMLRVFPNMPVVQHMFKPEEFGLKHIGHMKFFSQKTFDIAPKLWLMAKDWIVKHS